MGAWTVSRLKGDLAKKSRWCFWGDGGGVDTPMHTMHWKKIFVAFENNFLILNRKKSLCFGDWNTHTHILKYSTLNENNLWYGWSEIAQLGNR